MDTAFDRLRRYPRGYKLLLDQVARRVVPNATSLARSPPSPRGDTTIMVPATGSPP